MTLSDFYVTLCVGGIVVTIAAAIGWLVEHGPAIRGHWHDYRQRAADLRAVRPHVLYPDRDGMIRIPAGGLKVGQQRTFHIPANPGTIQNPSDPSPRPHVQRFGSRFPR